MESPESDICKYDDFLDQFTTKFSNSLNQRFNYLTVESYATFKTQNMSLSENYCRNNYTYFSLQINPYNDNGFERLKNDEIYVGIDESLQQALNTTSNMIDHKLNTQIFSPGFSSYKSLDDFYDNISLCWFIIPAMLIVMMYISKSIFMTLVFVIISLFEFNIFGGILNIIQILSGKLYSSYVFYFSVLVLIVT